MKKIFKHITIHKVAAAGVIGLAFTAAYGFGSFVCKRALPLPVKLIISGVGGSVIGATGGEIAGRLWKYDGSTEIIAEHIESI